MRLKTNNNRNGTNSMSYDDVVLAILECDGMAVGKYPGLPGTIELVDETIMFRTYGGTLRTIYEAVPQSCTYNDHWEISILRLDH